MSQEANPRCASPATARRSTVPSSHSRPSWSIRHARKRTTAGNSCGMSTAMTVRSWRASGAAKMAVPGLHIPLYTTALRIIRLCFIAVNGQARSGYVYNWTSWLDDYGFGKCTDASKCNVFPDGKPFLQSNDWRRKNYVYVWHTMGEESPQDDGSLSRLNFYQVLYVRYYIVALIE